MELQIKTSYSSELDGGSSISESEASTAPSSLQTIVRSPYKNHQSSVAGNNGILSSNLHGGSNGQQHTTNQTGINSLSSECSDLSPPTTPIPHPQPPFSTITTYTPEAPCSSSLIPTRRTSQPINTGTSENGGVNSDLDSVQNHAQNLRKVSEQLLSNPRTRQSFTGANVALPSVGIPVIASRPGSVAR